MRMSQALRLLSGSVLLFVFIFGIWHSDVWWFWKLFIVFMALNQIQSAFTNWCPAINMLKKLRIQEDC